MKRTRPLLLGFLLGITALVCMAQTIRGPVLSTPFSRSLLDDTTAAAARSTLGITGSTNYVFDTGQFTITDTSDVHLKDGLTVSNLIVKTAMTNDALTASRGMATDANKKIVSTTATAAEIDLLSGVTTRPAGTNVFESTQFDIRAAHIGVKDAALFTNITSKTTLNFSDGSAAAPGLTFADDVDNGLYRIGADNWGLSVGGTGRMSLTTTTFDPVTDDAVSLGSTTKQWTGVWAEEHYAALGTAALPAYTFNGDVDTGFWSPGANQLSYSTVGVQRWDFGLHITPFVDVTYDIGTSSKAVRDIFFEQAKAEDGTQSNPSYTFTGDTDTGMFSSAADKIYWSAGGVVYMALDSNHLEYTDSQPEILLNEYDAGSNLDHWLISANGGNLNIQTETDAGGTQTSAMSFLRTGNNVDDIYLPFDGTGDEGLVVGSDGSGDADARLHVFASANGDVVQRLEGESGGGLGDIVEDTYMARVETTDATITTLHTVPITASRTYFIEATVTARRTGGAAGTADDGAVYILRAMVTTKSGTVTIDSVVATLVAEDVAAYACTLDVSTTNIRVRVTGVASTTIDWACKVTAQAQGL